MRYFVLGAPEITLIAVGSAIVLALIFFIIIFASIKGKIKSLSKKTDECAYELFKALNARHELLKELTSRKDSLKKYEEEVNQINVPVAVSSIDEKNAYYNSLIKYDEFDQISAEAQIEIHASDDLINELIDKYNSLADSFNKEISSWPSSMIAKTYGYGHKVKFLKNSQK